MARDAWIGITAIFLVITFLLASIPVSGAAEPSSVPPPADGTVHPMTAAEVKQLKEAWGVRDPAVDYNPTFYGHGTGYAPPTEEQYAAMVGNVLVRGPLQSAVSAEAACDLTSDPRFPAVGDQGNVGSCAAWALAYYCYGYLEAKDNNWSEASLGRPSQLMSPSWCYNKVNGGKDAGTWMGEVGSVLTTWGGATLATMPYVGTGTSSTRYLDWGGEDAFREAPLHRALSVVTLDLDQPWSATLSSIKAVVASGTPVTFAIDASVLDPSSPGDGVISSAEYVFSGLNHAQTIVGYDDSRSSGGEVGAFKVANSWGDDFWSSGYYWITYKGFQKVLSSNGANQLVYVIDREDYSPSILGVWHYSSPQKQDMRESITVSTVGGSEVVRPYYWESSAYFPYFLCLDLSDLRGEYDLGKRTFELSVTSSTVGSLSSFRTELYDGGYWAGAPTWVSGPSPDTPVVSASARATSTLPPFWSESLAEAMDIGGVNVTSGGAACWSPTAAEAASGSTSVRSGDVAASSSSWLKLRLEGDGVLAFDWKMDAGPYPDVLTLSIGGSERGKLNGTTSWTHVEVPIHGSSTELVWSYLRHGNGGGCAYVDNLTWSNGDLRIDGNADLQRIAEQMRWPGSGAPGDPYIIDGYISQAPSSSFGLYIGNTTLSVEIAHGRFSEADEPGQFGLRLFNASNVAVSGSTFTGNDGGLFLDHCSNVLLSSVLVVGSTASGIQVMDCDDLVIIGCNVSENVEGLSLLNTQATVHDNLFYRNMGLAIRSIASPGSVFYANAFEGNNGTTAVYDELRPQAFDDSVGWWDLEIGNHWSDLSGPDLDGDVEIDGAVYRIGAAVDHHPAAYIISAPRSLFADQGGTDVTLSWDAPGRAFYVHATEYEISRSGPEGVVTYITSTNNLLDDRSKMWGDHAYMVRALTWLGAGPFSTPVAIYIPDTTPPSVSIVSPRDGSYYGKLTLSASWTCSDDQSGLDHIAISQDGGPFVDVGPSSATSLTFLSAGTHRLDVRAFDHAGNNAEDSVVFSIDLSPPIITVLSPAPGSVLARSTVSISVAVRDVGSGYHRDTVSVDGREVWSGTDVSPIALNVELSDGTHRLTVVSTDRVGNSASAAMEFEVDTSPPVVKLYQPAEDEIYPHGGITAAWSVTAVTDIASVELSLDGGSWTDVTGTESVALGPLPEGRHTLVVRAMDDGGRRTEAWANFTVDTSPPSLTIIEPLGGAISGSSTVVLSWAAEDESGLNVTRFSIDGGDWVEVDTMQHTLTLTGLADGEHQVDMEATDLAGNVNVTSVSFGVDTEAVIAWLDPASNVPLGGPITIVFSKAINTSTLQWSCAFPASASVGANGLVLVPTSGLEAGREYMISVLAEGLNGLCGGWTELTFDTVDRGMVSGMVKDSSGRSLAGVLITSSDGSSAITDENGTYSLELPFGPAHLTAHKDGYADLEWDVQVQAGESVSAGAGQMVSSSSDQLLLPTAAVVIAATISVLVWRFKKRI